MHLLLLLACLAGSSDTADARRPAEATVSSSALAWQPSASEAAPMALTAADGTGLKLASLDVTAVIDDPLAFTQLHLVFENPEDRVLEGRFEITLPPGAAVSRFAMKLGELWQEGEVVELQAARRAYEDFLHRRTDPALLEFDAGNEFAARVFPIPAKGKKEIIISWSHPLDATEAWALPTGGLPELGLLTAKVTAGGKTYAMEREYLVPEGDLALGVARTGPGATARNDRYAVMRVQPKLSVAADPIRSATILFDTSASRALSLEDSLRALQAVVASFDRTTSLKVVAYDQTREVVFQGRAGEFGPGQLDRIRARGAFGASDLASAIGLAEGGRLLLFTDGVATAGGRRPDELRAAVKGVERVDAVVSGGVRDEGLLAQLVTAGLPRHGVVLDADRLEGPEIARRVALGASGSIEVGVPGAEWVWPNTVAGVQPGDTVLVHAAIPSGAPLSLTLDGEAVALAPERRLPGPLLDRSAAWAELQRLSHLEARASDPAERAALIARAVEVSTSRRVLSPHTALLVLETEQDYERFGIDRKALADILTVKDGELTWLARGTPVYGTNPIDAPVNENRDAPPEPEAEEKAKKSMSMESDAMERPSRSAPARERRADRAPDAPPPPPPPPGEPAAESARMSDDDSRGAPSSDPLAAWEGRYREVMVLLRDGALPEAERLARDWLAQSPGDPLALLALGEAIQRRGALEEAARVYGSIIDLFPSRADLRRLAGERLEAIGEPGLAMAIDTYRAAVEQRPDHPSGHRNLAWALARAKRWSEALDVLASAHAMQFPRFEAAHRILAEDASILGAAWRKAEPNAPVAARLLPFGTEPATKHSLRFVLNWETDANDVDFHIYDAKGGHAYYSARELPSGGSLYADITSGYGPECFHIDKPAAFPYTLQAHYYSRGPMGFGMGKLQVVEHDGRGGLSIEDRPFVVMTDGAYVPLGEVPATAFR